MKNGVIELILISTFILGSPQPARADILTMTGSEHSFAEALLGANFPEGETKEFSKNFFGATFCSLSGLWILLGRDGRKHLYDHALVRDKDVKVYRGKDGFKVVTVPRKLNFAKRTYNFGMRKSLGWFYGLSASICLPYAGDKALDYIIENPRQAYNTDETFKELVDEKGWEPAIEFVKAIRGKSAMSRREMVGEQVGMAQPDLPEIEQQDDTDLFFTEDEEVVN